MARIRVGVVDPTDSEKVSMEVPDDVLVADLTAAMVDAMALPTSNADERRRIYYLHRLGTEGNVEQRLDIARTLRENGVVDGASLRMGVEMIAGGLVLSVTTDSSASPTSSTAERPAPSLPQIASNELLLETAQSVAKLGERLADLEVALNTVSQNQDAGLQRVGEQIKGLQDECIPYLKALTASSSRQRTLPGQPDAENEILPRAKPVTYLDFDIVFFSEGDRGEYRVESLWIGGDQKHYGRHRSVIPISLVELDRDYLRNMGIVSRSTSRSLALAEELGGKLFDAVFDGTVRDCFRDCQHAAERTGCGVRIRLDLLKTPELINYPWELLWQDSFLVQNLYTPVVRYLRSVSPKHVADAQPPYRMLVAISSATGYSPLNSAVEKANLQETLGPLVQAGLLKIDWLEHTTPETLRRALTANGGPHILHYVGHGDFDDRRGGFLVLERASGTGEIMDGHRLATLVLNCPNVRLVTLNTCRGARSKADDPFASIALQLVRKGAPAVVAMQHEILDDVAICFSREFYACLANGEPVSWAVSNARLALYNDQVYDIEWFIPVLYSSSPDSSIFKQQGQAPT